MYSDPISAYPAPAIADATPLSTNPTSLISATNSESAPSGSTVPQQPISFANMIHYAETYREPTTYKQATISPQVALSNATMKREYDSLMENRAWILVPPPPGRTIVQCKWVYKIKYTSTCEIDKYKAGLVAK